MPRILRRHESSGNYILYSGKTKKMSEFLNALKNKTTIDATEQDFMKVEDNADAP